ncbi:MAG: hypothetical protein IKM42_02605 [Clostridia bacterium]|nr:hypothetical protein [Clostridia bacterium]
MGAWRFAKQMAVFNRQDKLLLCAERTATNTMHACCALLCGGTVTRTGISRFARIFFALPLTSKLDALCGENANPCVWAKCVAAYYSAQPPTHRVRCRPVWGGNKKSPLV